MKAHHQFIHRLKDQRGVSAIIVAIVLVVLIGFAAFAVDIGYLYATKNELQNIADAAALAGAGELGDIYEQLTGSAQGYELSGDDQDQIRIAARSVVLEGRNIAGWHNIDIFTNDILINNTDEGGLLFINNDYVEPDAVRVIARRSGTNTAVATFFAKILGILEVPVGADATAALTAPCLIAELELPIGLSELPFPDPPYPDTFCSDLIEFSPTADSCAGWHNFDRHHSVPELRNTMFGNIAADLQAPDGDCVVPPCGQAWLDASFDIDPPEEPETPDAKEDEDLNFTGGNLATLFNGGWLQWEEDGVTPVMDPDSEPERQLVLKNQNEDGSGGVISYTDPAPFPALFDYFRFRDGDLDDEFDPNDPLRTLYTKDEKWTTTAPVYKAEEGAESCVNPTGSRKIVGFVIVEVIMPKGPPDKTVQARVHCEFTVISGRGGCGGGPVHASIPNLVE